MNEQPHFAIVGAGAVGGFYGALLQRSGQHVHFLLHRDVDHVREQGLRVESPLGDFHLPRVRAHSTAAAMPRCDVVIVALKTTANAALPGILPHLVKEDGVVLTLQNGLGSDELIARVVGADRVLGGLCFLCSNKVGPGHIRHLDYGLITLGEYRADGSAGGVTPRLERVGGHLEAAGIPTQCVGHLAAARWRKLVWNIPFNGLSVARGQLTDQLVRAPATRALCERMMREVAAAAAALGHPIEEAFIQKMLSDTERMAPYAPSMKLDFDRGNAMELEAIYGAPLNTAARVGVEMPATRALHEELVSMNPAAAD